MPGAQTRPLDVYFDYRSPFAYIAAEVLPDFAERHGLGLTWHPTDIMLLGNYATGLPYSEIKARYVAVDAMRTAEAAGVFGVPAMLLDSEQFWGIDSLPQLAWRLGQAS
jgi:2-hydroxychromene-2-carboxylate isomerase